MTSNKLMIRTDSLSTDRLNGNIDEDLVLCVICQNILWKPVACKTCENSFCSKCIRLWLIEKPNTCPFNCRFQERKCPSILMTILAKLKLDCRHKSSGCIAVVPYEALEKHELQECEFRITQCPGCMQEMLKKDLDLHQQDGCELVELTCLKCDTTYNQRQKHTEVQCLEKQLSTVKKKLETSDKNLTIMQENYKKMEEKYIREQKNDDYAKRKQLSEDVIDNAPSAPIYESPTPATSTLLKSTQASTSLFYGSSRISTITFARIPHAQREGARMPDGYAGFRWYNVSYMFEIHALECYSNTGYANAFTNGKKCVAYNGEGTPMSITLPNPRQTFGLHSFEAISIYRENFLLKIIGYRRNILIDTKIVALTTQNPTLFEIDWESIDEIKFESANGANHSVQNIFALTCLNVVL